MVAATFGPFWSFILQDEWVNYVIATAGDDLALLELVFRRFCQLYTLKFGVHYGLLDICLDTDRIHNNM